MRSFILIVILLMSLGVLTSPQVNGQSMCDEPAVTPSDPSELWYARTNGQTLIVREYPARECLALEALPNGTIIEVTGFMEGWQQIRLEDGRTGYVTAFLTSPFSQIVRPGSNTGTVRPGARQLWVYSGMQGEILNIQLSPVSENATGSNEIDVFDATLGIYQPDTHEFGNNSQETLRLANIELAETGTYTIEVIIKDAARDIKAYELNIQSRLPTAVLPTSTTTLTTDESVIITAISPTSTLTHCPRPEGWFDYIIRDGDTISLLALRAGTSIDNLRTRNCLSSNLIYVGQSLYLPVPISPSETSMPTFPAAVLSCVPSVPAGWVYFTIRPGDTLSGLASNTNTTVDDLMTKNCLNSTNIVAGQQIFLSKLPPTPISMTPLNIEESSTPCHSCTPFLAPTPEPRGISISLGSPGTYGSRPNGIGCDVVVYVTVTGVDSVSANVHVRNAAYGSDGDVYPGTTFARGTSGGYNVSLGGEWPTYKDHTVWVSSSIGESNRVGISCNNP